MFQIIRYNLLTDAGSKSPYPFIVGEKWYHPFLFFGEGYRMIDIKDDQLEEVGSHSHLSSQGNFYRHKRAHPRAWGDLKWDPTLTF